MATTPVTPAPLEDLSMADIRSMLGGTKAPDPAIVADPKPVTPEPAAGDPPAEHHEPESGAGEQQPTPEPKEDELPEGVKKRIAREVERETRAQRAIDEAVSRRKLKEAELEKLKTGEKGSEPVKTPQSQANERPKRPTLGEAGHERETWDQFLAREAAYEDARDEWIRNQAVREFEEKQSRQAEQQAAQERWDAAVQKHGRDFPALMESARALAPEGLQVAISSLEHWDVVAVYLAKNTDKLRELAATFTQNPTRAIATLGRMEASLAAESKPKATAEKPLPEPIKKVGGSAAAGVEDLQKTLEEGSMTQLRARLNKLRR